MIDTQLPIKDKKKVGTLIPQKYPFAMVDALHSYSETHIVAGITVEPDNIFVDNGVFNEPGVIEHMAQSVALHTGYQFYLMEQEAPVGYIGSIKKIQIEKLPSIADRLETLVTIMQEFMGVTLVKIETKVNGVVIATGEMKTVIVNQNE